MDATKPITGFCNPKKAMALHRQTHLLSTCHRHPTKPITGFCAPCLSERLAGLDPTRRKSCDVRARNTLSELFNIDDDRKGLPRKFEVELRGEEQRDDSGDEARVLDSNAEFKTMKELIDLEWERKKGAGRDLKEIAGTFRGFQ
ncbi:hypothetical protein CerSpe_061620 [Prunus speciosa]